MSFWEIKLESIKIVENYDYKKLVDFFIKQELEFDKDDISDDDVLKSYTAFMNDELIGAVVLAKRDGEFIIDGIAVKDEYRKMGLGELLLTSAENEARVLNKIGDNKDPLFMYLVARAPNFFKKNKYLNTDESPDFFECRTCPQFKNNCFPEILKKDISKEEHFCEHNCGEHK